MGNPNSTRWKEHTKKTRAEACERITAREAKHTGAPTLSEPVANSAAKRLWCLCPDCEKRALHLYRLPSGDAWKCRRCHRLTDAKAQEKGTRAAFEKALERHWPRILREHGAAIETRAAIAEDYRENVAPFDWDTVNEGRRAQLLETYASMEIVRRVFQRQRDEHATRTEEQMAITIAMIKAEFWQWWKKRNRSKARTAPTP